MRTSKNEPDRETLVVPKQPQRAQPTRERPANEPVTVPMPQRAPQRKKAA